MTSASGPLAGIRVIELAGIGPLPFCGMLLSDMGADVVRVDRKSAQPAVSGNDARPERPPLWDRGRRSIALDLKQSDDLDVLLRLVGTADALIEGYRPGVAERLGVGPDECLETNPRLVYGRMTGYGQSGPSSAAAGHDLNFIALSGALASIGRRDQLPTPPLNLIGDFGGGGMLLAVGVCAALLSAARSGRGQVVDAAMLDGSALLMTSVFGMRAQGHWQPERGTNLIDSGAPFYDVYETTDGRLVAVAAIERQFFDRLVAQLGLSDHPAVQDRMSRRTWPSMRAAFESAFKSKTRDEWIDHLAGTDCCVTPVCDLEEAPVQPHALARQTFVTYDGQTQPAPAPRFSDTPARIQRGAAWPGEHTEEVIADWLSS